MLPGLAPSIIMGAPGLSPIYLGQASSGANAQTFNFGSFVAPSAGELVVAAFSIGATQSVTTSISIGGANGTMIQKDGPTIATQKFAMAYREVPAGSHNVTLNLQGLTGASSSTGVFVWFIKNYVSAAPATSAKITPGSGTSYSLTMNLPARSVALYATLKNGTGGGAGTSSSWSSATKNDDQLWGTGRRASAATLVSVAAQSGHVETVSFPSATTNFALMVGAVWI